MESETLLLEERDGLFIITLNRPDKKNALNSQMWRELCDAIERFEKDDALRVAILTNTGDVFCAGSDLKELNEGTYHAPEGREEWGFGGMSRHYCPKPIIAAVNGRALGGGAEMVMAADLAVMTVDGAISFPEVKHSLLATGGGALLRAGRSIPFKRAMELMLTGEWLDAQTAFEWGLVNRVAEPGRALDCAIDLARAVLKNGPIAIEWTKLLLHDSMDKSFITQSDGWRAMLEFDKRIKKTHDAHEGEAAFAEGRQPVWRGC